METTPSKDDATPGTRTGNVRRVGDEYRRAIRELSDRIVEAQRPIRILDAVKWGDDVRRAFLEGGGAVQPRVNRAYYADRPLGFDPEAKREELHGIERDVARRLGELNPVGAMMRRITREYLAVVRMLEARGSPEFARLSEELYGSPTDVFNSGGPTLADLARSMSETLANLEGWEALDAEEETLDCDQAIAWLAPRLSDAFKETGRPVRVLVSDGILADAAAGSDYLKLRRDARFSRRELRVLEVHEGWVHIGTTLNGLSQPYCTFLGKGPPSATITQEGLAIIMEVFSFASHPSRLRRLTNRVHGVELADAGATFLDIYRQLLGQGLAPAEAYAQTARVFRGSTPTGRPFTKDIAYHKGFILIYNFIRLAVRRGLVDRLPLLFCGKTTLADIRVLSELRDEGIVVGPRFVPEPFADLQGLVAWMSYSNFLNRVDLMQVEVDYANLL